MAQISSGHHGLVQKRRFAVQYSKRHQSRESSLLAGGCRSVGHQSTCEGVLTQAALPHQVEQGAGLEEVRHGELLEEEAVTIPRPQVAPGEWPGPR